MPKDSEAYKLKHFCCSCDKEKPVKKLRLLQKEESIWFKNVTFDEKKPKRICTECFWNFGKNFIAKNPSFLYTNPKYQSYFHASRSFQDDSSITHADSSSQTFSPSKTIGNPKIITENEKATENEKSSSRLSFSPAKDDNKTYMIEKRQFDSLLTMIPCQTCGFLLSNVEYYDQTYGGCFRAEKTCTVCQSVLKFHSSSFLSGGACKIAQLAVVSEILAGNTYKSYKGITIFHFFVAILKKFPKMSKY